jgi:hypothetical protein
VAHGVCKLIGSPNDTKPRLDVKALMKIGVNGDRAVAPAQGITRVARAYG